MINTECNDIDQPDNDYKTPAGGHRSLWDRIFRLLNIHFYFRCFVHVAHQGRLCRKGTSTTHNLAQCCGRVLRGCELSGGMVTIEGTGNVTSEPCVFVGNHMSTLETVTLPFILRRSGKLSFVVKESLFKHAMFKHIMTFMKCIPMTRTDPRKDLKLLMDEGVKRLEEGYSVVVFPQKTRTHDFIPEEFNSIGVKLAKRAGVPVQPLALDTSMLNPGKFITDFGPISRERPVRFAIGKRLEFEDHNPKEIHQACIDYIEGKLNDWKEEGK